MDRSSTLCSLLLLAFLLGTTSALTCGQVDSFVYPCLGYASNGGVIPPSCCSGVRSLENAAKSSTDRQTACSCLKSVASPSLGLNADLVAGIPGKCGVNIPYAISMKTDCTKVS